MWTEGLKGKFQGVLIDLDFASGPEDHPTYIPDVVPFSFSIPFLALDLLEQEHDPQPHIYRHDLESFLWTFLYLILSNRRVKTKEFFSEHWQVGSKRMIAVAKSSFLDPKIYNEVFGVLTRTWETSSAELIDALRKMTILCAAGREALASNDTDRVTAGGYLTYENFMLALGHPTSHET